MKWIALLLSVLGALAGVWAAVLWRGASKAWPDPHIIPDDVTAANLAWIGSIGDGLAHAERLNASAALLTGASVVLNGFAAVIATVGSN